MNGHALEPYIWGQKAEGVMCPLPHTPAPHRAFSDEVSGPSLLGSGPREQARKVRCLGMSHSFSALLDYCKELRQLSGKLGSLPASFLQPPARGGGAVATILPVRREKGSSGRRAPRLGGGCHLPASAGTQGSHSSNSGSSAGHTILRSSGGRVAAPDQPPPWSAGLLLPRPPPPTGSRSLEPAALQPQGPAGAWEAPDLHL